MPMTIAMTKNGNGNGHRNGDRRWKITKEKILMFSGLGLIWYAAISVLTFDVSAVSAGQIILGGLALCGVSIAQWGDKNQ